jgi:hypothetical protein
MTEVRPEEPIEDKSLGELVAMATSSLSRLVKSEIELAKMELKDDASCCRSQQRTGSSRSGSGNGPRSSSSPGRTCCSPWPPSASGCCG